MPTATIRRLFAPLVTVLALVLGLGAGLPAVSAAPLDGGPPATDKVARGKWLVEVLGCNVCHTPRLPDGRPDANFLLAGHRANDPYPVWSDSLFGKGYGMLVST